MNNLLCVNFGIGHNKCDMGHTVTNSRTRAIAKKAKGRYGNRQGTVIKAETNIGDELVFVEINTRSGALKVTPSKFTDDAIKKLSHFLFKN